MEIATVSDLLYWSYANLAMAHAAVTSQAAKYDRTHFMIRSRLFSGLRRASMQLGPLADDERLKMILPQSCCYCGSKEYLAADHLIPSKKGGANTGDNLVWACRACNSSKCASDVLEWLAKRQQFPSLLLLRRYLKLAIEPASDDEMLRHLMEIKGVSQIQLSRDTGISKSTVSEVLSGKKPFSRHMIRKLANYFHIDVTIMAANL